jgi:CelD/BcsL family acetyltransferase involved in cellulose biosynthesis
MAGAEKGPGVYCIETLDDLEQALTEKPLNQWGALMERDPYATLFQSPGWCLPWYRSYSGFAPQVLVVRREGELAGVVPLAREAATGKITFAGDHLTDYRDVVTLPECRTEVLRALVLYLKRYRNLVYFGSTLPGSESPAILTRLCAEHGIHTVPHTNSGWRWWPDEQTEDPMTKKSVRYPTNYFSRQGELSAEHITTADAWRSFRDDFYDQHSLRQIFAGRPVSFCDPEKRAFFDTLFDTPYAHVTALRFNGQLIAGHVGYVEDKVLYWGAPSFDIRYRQYSPNLLLLVFTMKNAAQWGLRGIDLTVGKGDLKERFSTSRVDLPLIELFLNPGEYRRRRVLNAASGAAKAAAARLSPGLWEKKLRPGAAALLEAIGRSRNPRAMAARFWGWGRGRIVGRSPDLLLEATPRDVRRPAPEPKLQEPCGIHRNCLPDLLKHPVGHDEAAGQITEAVRQAADMVKRGSCLHTVVTGGRLAAWCFSSKPGQPTVTLSGLYTVPEFRNRKIAQMLVCSILECGAGASETRFSVEAPAGNSAAVRVFRNSGFREVARAAAASTSVAKCL